MTAVRVEPSGITLEVDHDAGESIFHAAIRLGYSWPTVCGGRGSCLTCVLQVLEGDEHLAPAESWEEESLTDASGAKGGAGVSYRLACQAIPSGEITVRKSGVRRLKSGKF